MRLRNNNVKLRLPGISIKIRMRGKEVRIERLRLFASEAGHHIASLCAANSCGK
jgi:hypothetical protein